VRRRARSVAVLAGASLVILGLGLGESRALADGAAAAGAPAGASCGEAYTNAQTLRNARKLVQARDALRICAQPTCKDFIVKDCADWLDQVQRSLPSVVPVATDPQGNPIFNVKVLVDGAPFVDKIEGRSVDVDPGPHTFTFETTDGTKAEKQVLVTEGEHDKRVAVTLGAGAPAPANATPPGNAAQPTTGGTPPAGPPAGQAPIVVDSSGGGLQWKAIGLANAGVGVAALAVGGVFGGLAISKKNNSGCTSKGVCPPADAQNWRDAGTAASTSTILFVAGGVFVAGGLAMWFLAPSSKVQAAPAVGTNGGGIVVRGTW
jgi:hypothetical protein